MSLFRVVYYSRNLIPGSLEMIEAEVRRILETSCRNNAAEDVTGALLFNSGCFAQVLEGPYEAVERTFERIQMDERHADVVPLQFEAVASRGFSNWSMVYVGSSVDGEARYGSFAGESGFDPSRLDAEAIFRSLRGLVLTEERAAAA
jgi:hypothetical protein